METLTREQYRLMKRAKSAGTVRELETETVSRWAYAYPEWSQRHWHMYMRPGAGTTLAPCNVEGLS